jgi:hypothetical protein
MVYNSTLQDKQRIERNIMSIPYFCMQDKILDDGRKKIEWCKAQETPILKKKNKSPSLMKRRERGSKKKKL